MNRKSGIVVALSLTGLVLITILALGFGRANATSNDINSLPPTASGDVNSADLQQQLAAWQEYSRQLEQTVGVMQGREAQYQQQLQTANQTIGQLQDQLNNGNGLRPRPFFQEREGNEFDD